MTERQPPAPLTTPHGKSALTRLVASTTATVKATITDLFGNLNNFAVLAGTPSISGGKLVGTGAVRHIDRLATDNFKVTATVGELHDGKTWLVTCANWNFDRFYALEIERGAGTNIFRIVKGTGLVATTSTGLFGVVIGVLGFVVGLFADIIASWFTDEDETQSVSVNDTVTIWWDQSTSTVRTYKNGNPVNVLPVDRHEIPHGEDYRYFGVVTGVADPLDGVYFTAIEAEDV